MDLKIIGPIKTPLKEFDSPDEFNLYYDRKIKPDEPHEENTNQEILERLQKLEEVVNNIIDLINGETKQ